MACKQHQDHSHQHSDDCGHTKIKHEGHVDYLHDGHLHHPHGEHYDEHVLAVTQENPEACRQSQCSRDHAAEGDEKVPHGSHMDYIFEGKLHHPHDGHCDDHGPVEVVK